jgi:urate oxidase
LAVLQHHSYGKSSVRLTKVARSPQRHELMELSVDILLEGDFADSYLTGDNRKIIATDSMKNTVYVLARENDFHSIEQFAQILCRHFVKTYPQVTTATVDIAQTTWDRIQTDQHPHPHAFVGGGSERRTCQARLNAKSKLELSGGIADLQVLKTTGSEFSNFVSDRYRTLKDAPDRIFATTVDARWTYGPESADFNAAYAAIRQAMLKTFAEHHSLAVQQTLLEMGKAALAASAAIQSIELKMPNQHRILFNLEPFGLENKNEIFVPMAEPYGMISGVVKRE